MSTPADAGGYIDPETGQFIPGSFADVLDLPSAQPTTDPAELARMQQQISILKTQPGVSAAAIQAANHRAQVIKQQLGNKKLPPAARARLTTELRKQQQIVTSQKQVQERSTQQLTSLQTKYYTATGQYENLLTGPTRDAYAALKALFTGYGLQGLAGKIYEYAKQGYGADTITLLLQDTKEYKERFAANEDRTKKGLPVLSPAEYLSLEQSYRQIMQDSGLPKGFYDSPTDFRNWISGDVSPTEVKGRIDLAVANTMQANNSTVQALKALYGVDQNMITAYFLDQKKALPILQKQAQAASFGGEALKRGLTLDRQNLEDFVTAGLSLSQVSSGFQAVAEALPNMQAIAGRFGEFFSQRELEKDIIEGGVTGGTAGESPTTKRKRLASQERALFGGFGGATPGGLSAGYQPT